MKELTPAMLRGLVSFVFSNTFGLRVESMKSIHLLESSGDGRYIRFYLQNDDNVVEYIIHDMIVTGIYPQKGEIFYESQHYIDN